MNKKIRSPRDHAVWGAVFSMALGSVVLIASEFMPVSLLSPLATDLGLSQGQAGQAISFSGLFAVLSSLLNAPLTGRFDRKKVLVCFTLLLTFSGLLVTMASNQMMFMLGRALLGVAIGGFWSMSTATVMRLVPPHSVAKGLAVINGGNALAATIAAPLGSFLGQYIGWRGAFLIVVPLAVLAFIWQWRSIPSLPPVSGQHARNPFRLFRNKQVSLGMAGMMALFMGQFAIFTYFRPFMETITRISVSALSVDLLLMGAAGLAGTWLIGLLLKRGLFRYLVVIPLLMVLVTTLMILTATSASSIAVLMAVWGLVATPAPVAWGLWLSRALPQDAEAGGGLMVAVIQMAITVGASVGGLLFDHVGWRSPFLFGSAILALSAIFALMACRDMSQNTNDVSLPAPTTKEPH
ncbi:putative MFS-family transport protein [Klebsiella variicola]|uniref:MFS-family transport protein n=1 Tax=Klebsiella variicola TaxID=244366 RepID=A0ABD7PET8_KLEVA|nr:MFS transporter [Klebsiella variicola]SXF99575.1 putative MFS-family transport protein [Klebsiella variicola]